MPRVALVNLRPLRLAINLRWVPRKCSLGSGPRIVSSGPRIVRCAAGTSAEEETPKRLAQPAQRLSRLQKQIESEKAFVKTLTECNRWKSAVHELEKEVRTSYETLLL